MNAIHSHYGESMIRARFADYVTRFVRLAARYEQDTLGSTKIDFPSKMFVEGQLGSGMTFSEDAVRAKEMALNGPRIEGWRRSRSYQYYKDVGWVEHPPNWTPQLMPLTIRRTFNLPSQNDLSEDLICVIKSSASAAPKI